MKVFFLNKGKQNSIKPLWTWSLRCQGLVTVMVFFKVSQHNKILRTDEFLVYQSNDKLFFFFLMRQRKSDAGDGITAYCCDNVSDTRI